MNRVPRRRRVLEAVLRLGECTVAQVRAEVGRYISASEAALMRARAIRHRGRQGGDPRQLLVLTDLARLVRGGKLRRVWPGVYAPPLPTIYKEGRAG